MRVMGVDPGLTRCGLSVIEGGQGRKVTALDVDVVRTPSDESLPRRLLIISDTVEHWMDTHRPDVVAIERVFAQQNVSTVMGTAQAGGVIALAAAKRGIDVHFRLQGGYAVLLADLAFTCRSLLGWEAQIDIRTGIGQTVDWLRGHVEAPAQQQ